MYTKEILRTGNYPVISQSQNLIDGYSNNVKKLIHLEKPAVMFGDHTKNVKFIDFDFIIGADGTKFFIPIIMNSLFLYYCVLYYSLIIPTRGYARHYCLLKQAIFPLPPLAEQERIVSAIEKFEPLIAEYDKLEQQATKLDNEIYDKLKKSILQYAIQGKLVPQDPNDEPASELLKRIRAEKKAKLGKKYIDSYIYKGADNCYYEKVGSVVKNIDDEINFDLPENWEYIRLSTVCWLDDTKKTTGEFLPYLDAKTLREKTDITYLNKGKVVDCGTRVILVDGENSGEVFSVPFRGYMGSTFKILGASKKFNIHYLNKILNFYKDIFRNNKIGAAIPHLNKSLFKSLIIGLPPLAEQHRINSMLITLEAKLKNNG